MSWASAFVRPTRHFAPRLIRANCVSGARILTPGYHQPQRSPSRLYASTPAVESRHGASGEAAASSVDAPRLKVKEILQPSAETEGSLVGRTVTIKGWVRTIRSQKAFSFIEVNDGSTMAGLQVVADAGKVEGYAEAVAAINTGAAIGVVGTIKESPGKGQKYEIAVEQMFVPAAEEAPQPRVLAVYRTPEAADQHDRWCGQSAALAYATHKFFQDRGFLYLQIPIITASDCEGAGEMFRVSTFADRVSKLPRNADDKDVIDYSKNVFDGPAFLTVSGQLSAETHACALGDVYTFGPTFRAVRENEDGETVAAMDVLVPGVGELIGGSQREERLDTLEAKIVEFGLKPEDCWWYLDLRRYGSGPHSGYGLGFERLVCYVTGIENIRDAVAFPRAAQLSLTV